MADVDQRLQKALLLHRQGSVAEAAAIYRKILAKDSNNVRALHYLGAIEAAFGNIDRAKYLMARSLSTARPNVVFIENYATVLFQAGDFDACLKMCERGLNDNSTSAILLFNRAMSLFRLNRLPESEAQFDALLSIHGSHIAALNERGSVRASMKQYESALESFDEALRCSPGFVEALINKGTVYWQLERYGEAWDAYERALSLRPEAALAWLGRGSVACALRRYDQALAACDKALELAPNLAEAWTGRGNVYAAQRSYDEADAAYERALTLNANLSDAWLGRGNVLFATRRYDDALAAYRNAIALNADFANAWFGCGNVLCGLKRFDEALSAYDRARALKPGIPGLASARLRTKMQVCDWSDFDGECAGVLSSFRSGDLTALPFELLSIPSTSGEQLECARRWVEKEFPASEAPIWRGRVYDHDRIHVAYVSADFAPHPVSFLAAGMFEHHDKLRFEITGISLGPENDTEIRNRVAASFERFLDARRLSDHQVAELIKSLEVDLLVDLNGFTGGGRTGIFAGRAAPVQINYLGYPGTLGAEYIQYIIADRIVIPEDRRRYYAEKIVYLPDSFLVNDCGLAISDGGADRAAFDLPAAGFVFCCFNNSYKIASRIFESWMRIIRNVDDSVLWLSDPGPEAAHNLRREAAASGVDPARLIFSRRLPRLAEHLARQRCADLFLDTLPYNAHATASHALWAGLPVLTCPGETFAGRVAASLLHAVDVPELIAPTLEAYERLAIELATDPTKLNGIRNKLVNNRLTAPLFDTRLFTRYIEAAYTSIYERHRAGLPPEHIHVSGR